MPDLAPMNIFQAKALEIVASSAYINAIRRPGRRLVGIRPYIYNVTVGAQTPLTLANGLVTQTIDTQADSDFALAYLSACVNISVNGDMKVNRNLLLQITDTTTGKNWYNIPTVMTLVAGGGGFPFVYPAQRVIPANTTLLFGVQNRDATQDYNNAFLSLGGIRLFYASNQ